MSCTARSFAPDGRWALDERVSLRDESFGALAYHYGNRRLLFLKSRPLVDVVCSLERFDSASEAVDALVEPAERDRCHRALARLAASEVIGAR